MRLVETEMVEIYGEGKAYTPPQTVYAARYI